MISNSHQELSRIIYQWLFCFCGVGCEKNWFVTKMAAEFSSFRLSFPVLEERFGDAVESESLLSPRPIYARTFSPNTHFPHAREARSRTRKIHTKSRRGCYTCKRRKIKAGLLTFIFANTLSTFTVPGESPSMCQLYSERISMPVPCCKTIDRRSSHTRSSGRTESASSVHTSIDRLYILA
jgi:hypothetical protein